MKRKRRGRHGMFSKSPYTTGPAVVLTKAEERKLIDEYQKTGDHDIVERVLKARAPWVQSVLSNLSQPEHVDMDAVFSDVMIAIYEALSTYDSSMSSLSTFLYRVVYNSMVTAVREQDIQAEFCIPELVLDHVEDLSECVDNVRRVVDNAPQGSMNERARKVANMMLRGYDAVRVSEVLLCTRGAAEEAMTAVRRYIAWLMVSEGLTAEPVIMDRELYALAMEHEASNESCWR